MQKIENFKRGDTFCLTVVYKIDDVASDIDSIDISSQIRTSTGTLVNELEVIKLEDTGKFTLNATDTETITWPLGILFCDIQFDTSGVIRSTETFEISVVEEVTK